MTVDEAMAIVDRCAIDYRRERETAMLLRGADVDDVDQVLEEHRIAYEVWRVAARRQIETLFAGLKR